MVLGLRRGDLIKTDTGFVEVLGRRIRRSQVTIQVLDGDEAMEIPLAQLMDRVVPAEPSLPPPADDAWLDELRPEVRKAALLKESDILDIIQPVPFDLTANDPDGKRTNRYADNVTEAIRIGRKLEDSRARRARIDDSKKASLNDRSMRVLTGLDVGIPWSRSRLYDAVSLYKVMGTRALVDKRYQFDIDVLTTTDQKVLQVFRDYFNRRNTAKIDLSARYAEVLAALREHGLARFLHDADAHDLPDAMEVLPYRRFRDLWSVLQRGAANSQSAKTEQSQRKRNYDARAKDAAFEFGDILEMDASPADFMVLGPDGEFKPHAVFAIDVATRYVWLRLIPGPPTAWDYLLLLFDIINPCEWESIHPDFKALTVAPGVVSIPTQRPHVVPGVVVLDHGKEGENHTFASALVGLGIDIHWARTRTPGDKPRVESFISKFAKSEQVMPGYKGNNPQNSPEQRCRHLISFEAASLIYRAWSNWYADQPHSGLKAGRFNRQRIRTPHEAVAVSLIADVPLRVADDPNLIFALLPFLELTPGEDGVEHRDVVYAPVEDYEAGVLKHAIKSGRGRRKLPFHYNPYDLSRLFFNVPGTRDWLVLYEPGGDDSVAAPFDDIRDEVTLSIASRRRPSNKERLRARDEAKANIVDPIAEMDRLRTADQPAPFALDTRKAMSAGDFISQLGLSEEDLALFDVEATDEEEIA